MLHTPALTVPPSNPTASALARRASDGFATQLTAPIALGDTTIPLASVSGLSTDTAVTLVIEPGTARQETIIGWVSSLNIINVARHCEGATIDHPINAIVMSYQTAQDHNSIIDFLLISHDPFGGLTPAAVNAVVTIPPAIPAGAVMQHAGASAPSGWLAADGSSLLRATYPALFTAIGTAHGAADGTHFNLPNLQGVIPVGFKSGDATFGALGATGGQKTVNLSHGHTVNAHAHGESTRASGTPNQNHTHNGGNGTGNATNGFNSTWTHNYNISDQASAPGTDAQLSAAQSVLNPFIVLNYIIKT